jgi:membrane protein DedA with SNARE-associated domain
VRSLISVPAGLARMNLVRFSAYTAVGTALWSFVLAFAGRLLGQQWELVTEFISQYEHFVLIAGVLAVVGFFAYRLIQRARRSESAAT